MSNSIWKTGYPKYEHDRCGDDIIQEYHREDGSKFYVVGDCSEPNDRWAYLTDIIAQADKAERLQMKVDVLEPINDSWAKYCEQKIKQIQRLQKAVDLAVRSFNEICAGVPSDIWVFDEATKATNEIKQLIKDE